MKTSNLSKQFINLSTQVSNLFMIMRDKFQDEPRVQNGMDDVNEFIKQLKAENGK